MPAYKSTTSLLTALARMAEELRQQILLANDLERMWLITRIVGDADMVFGVWPDPGEIGGFGVQIIKGEDLMPPLIGFETATEMRIAGIPCVGRAEAMAAREAWGFEGVAPEAEVCAG